MRMVGLLSMAVSCQTSQGCGVWQTAPAPGVPSGLECTHRLACGGILTRVPCLRIARRYRDRATRCEALPGWCILARMQTSEHLSHDRVLADRVRYVSGGVSTPRLVVAGADGARVTDVDGRVFVDFAGGIGCQNTGHRFAPVVDAIHQQVDQYLHQCFMVGVYEPYVDTCGLLAALSPCLGGEQKSILVNSGAEANENAVKIARAATGRPAVVVFDNAFHGRTLLTMTMTSKVHPFKAEVDPQTVACVLLEPVQGEGGFVPMPPDFPARLAELCAEHGILYVDDEVQSGVGRTGKMWAIEHYEGVEPDLLVSGKSIGGGLPLAAVMGRAELMDAVPAGGLGGTFGGNPLACAAAVAVMEAVREPEFLAAAVSLGETLRSRLDALAAARPEIGDVRGLGPMIAFELADRTPDRAKAIVDAAFERGLLLLACGLYGNVIRLLPALTISDEELEEGLALLVESVAAVDA